MYNLFYNNNIKHSNTKDFEVIKNYFNALNEDQNHFINSNDICTPMECVKEMVDKIPVEFWDIKNLKILDSCCGNGNFHAYVATKTPLKNLYFNDINEKRIDNLIQYFGKNVNLTNKDFLSFNDDEKYDLIVSNPPYAKFNDNVRVSKNHNLSRGFIEKALLLTKDGGYILFIVPNNWMSYSDRNILPKELSKFQFLHLDIHGAKKWFSKVGSSFTWFLLQKVPNKKAFTIANNYIIKDEQEVILDKNSNYIPLYYSKIVKSIFDKTINNKENTKYLIETTSNLHRFTKKEFISEEKTTEFKYRLIHTPTQTVWSKIPHKYQNGFKVFISLTNQYSTFIDDCGMTQSVAFVRCKDLKEAKKVKQELDNEIYIFINNLTRYGNFNNIRILQQFPILNTFTITTKELDFIQSFNSQYYGKKEK